MVASPKYRQIYELLRTQITEGAYSAGEAMPSENALAEAHRATRPTVRKALDLLASDGFIVKHQGKESVVKSAPKGIGILSITGTTSAVGQGNVLTHIILKPTLRQWTEAFSFPISEAEQGAGCIYFERLRVLEGRPVFLDITMLPNMNLPHFTLHSLENRSLFSFLRAKYRIEVTGGTQQLFAIRADKRLQKYLQVKAGFPVLQLNRKIETTRQGFHIYSQVFCATQAYGLTGAF
ncbi:MAG: GntR family transcriptional regulator [Prevotellaceae bacterium]|jgi:DNA-binding GntR family transcriptional regulator|nr:GntR family transcriptional regulator [Prevotellaceae bacterium]